jgi:hypothetical protein
MAGKLPVSFPDRYQYISTFTDDNSRHICVVLCSARVNYHKLLLLSVVIAKRKLEFGEIHTRTILDLKIEVTDIRIMRVHSDGGKEYENWKGLIILSHILHLVPPKTTQSQREGIELYLTPKGRCYLKQVSQHVSGHLRLSMSFTCGIACAMRPRVIPRTIW